MTLRRYHVFISHAGEEKRSFVAHLEDEFTTKHSYISKFIDDWSLKVGDDAPKQMDEACRTCGVGLVVLSPSFIRKRWPMGELVTLYRRWKEGKVGLVVALYDGLQVEDLDDMLDKYKRRAFWSYAGKEYRWPKDGLETLKAWADTLEGLTACTLIRHNPDRNDPELVREVVRNCVRLLEKQGLLPAHAGILGGLPLSTVADACMNQFRWSDRGVVLRVINASKQPFSLGSQALPPGMHLEHGRCYVPRLESNGRSYTLPLSAPGPLPKNRQLIWAAGSSDPTSGTDGIVWFPLVRGNKHLRGKYLVIYWLVPGVEWAGSSVVPGFFQLVSEHLFNNRAFDMMAWVGLCDGVPANPGHIRGMMCSKASENFKISHDGSNKVLRRLLAIGDGSKLDVRIHGRVDVRERGWLSLTVTAAHIPKEVQ